MERFTRFGGAHLVALAVLSIATAVVILWARRAPAHRRLLGRGLAAIVVGLGLGYVAIDASQGWPWSQIAPLHLCDVAVFVAGWALWRGDQIAYEITHYWGLAGTVPALIWPDLAEGFPHYRFLFYFGQHGTIVVAALVMTLGLGMRPRRRSPLYAWLALNGYAVLVAVVNLVADTNFLYLREAPGAGSPLDLFGPWPWYILGGEVIALGSFVLLVTPFLLRERLADGPR